MRAQYERRSSRAGRAVAVAVDGRGDRRAERRAAGPERRLELGGVEQEWFVELVGHLSEFPHHWIDEPERADNEIGHRTDADGMPDLIGDEVEDGSGAGRFRAG